MYRVDLTIKDDSFDYCIYIEIDEFILPTSVSIESKELVDIPDKYLKFLFSIEAEISYKEVCSVIEHISTLYKGKDINKLMVISIPDEDIHTYQGDN